MPDVMAGYGMPLDFTISKTSLEPKTKIRNYIDLNGVTVNNCLLYPILYCG